MKQGDVYWYTFRAPDKRRPVLILTRTSAIPYLTGITVAQITTTIRRAASEVLLTPGEDGVLAECVVNTDNMQTIQRAQLGNLITELSPERMREVRTAIEFALGFDALA
ncbi:MAG: type II toxin-antitoxin system PemK/MazF family toxin [Acidobacteriota bacterium]|nr:type II toxin-antitoxin system PemK/MazF family toxin [Acidobacteriota bacterium]